MCISIKKDKIKLLFQVKRKKNVIDNRKFWKTLKSMLSNKFVNSAKITLVDNEKIITNDKEIVKVLKDFFSNITKNLNIPHKSHTYSVIEILRDPTLKAILKYCKHPCFLAISRKTKSGPVFSFNCITKEDVMKGIKKLRRLKSITRR